MATRDLVGIAVDSLSASDGLTLTQLRLLVAVAESDGGSCSAIARLLGVSASTVTRMADRLHASGHLARAHAAHNRSVVLLTLTEHGAETVRTVLAHRDTVYEAALAAMDPATAAQVGGVLMALHEALARLGLTEHHPLL